MTKQIFPTEKLTHEFSKNGFQAKTFPNYDIQKSIFLNKINQEIDLESPKLDKYRFVHSHYRFTYYGSLLKKFFEKYSYN